MAATGLDKVAVTMDAGMRKANDSYMASQKDIAQETQALLDAKKAFDEKFGDGLMRINFAGFFAGIETKLVYNCFRQIGRGGDCGAGSQKGLFRLAVAHWNFVNGHCDVTGDYDG